jgi:hypothetical protein
MSKNMNLIKFVVNKEFCESCIVIKQKFESHKSFVIFDKHSLNLMWSDLVESFVSKNKIKYFGRFCATFIKRLVIYVLRVKSDTFEAFRHFELHNEHEENRVRRFCTNWKKEYSSNEFDDYRFEHDIEWKINRIKDFRAKWNRWTFKTNHHVNDQHYASERRFKWQLMNRVDLNNQLSSKSLFDDRQINYSLRSRHEKKILFRLFLFYWDNWLRYETKIDHEKKVDFKIVFDRARKVRTKSHLSNVAFQRDYLSCLICHLNKEKTWKITFRWDFRWNISKTINRWINRAFDEKTSSRIKFNNHSYLFVSAQLINYCRLILFNKES